MENKVNKDCFFSFSMEEYYFLFGIAFLWTLFAVVQDIRKREVSNWLNFSLLGIIIAYRAIYGILNVIPVIFIGSYQTFSATGV